MPDWESTLGALDTTNDGRMDYNEFLQGAANRYSMLENEDNLKRAFAILDKDGDGRLSA